MKLLKNFKLNDNTRKLNKVDWIIIGVMVLIYGILSFIRLGDTKVPSTYYSFTENEEVVVSLKEKEEITRMRYYTGYNIGEIKIYSSTNGVNYEEIKTINLDSVFAWEDVELNTFAKYIKFIAVTNGSTLGDVMFYHNQLPLAIEVEGNNPLTDEIDLVPEEISYMNSTYFDEIYYARTAYEYIHGINVYEWTHPPLGKLIITIPIMLFGFSPFTYRLMGNIFGILFIPVMYILAKRIFKNRKWALLAGLIMMFDNFHFVHTRIALIDGFQVLFILLSVLFMKEYLDLGKKDEFKKKAINLLLSGIFIGLAIDTKWNALYVGLGLAIVFFVHLFKEYHINLIKFFKENISINRVINILTVLIFIPFVFYYLIFVIIGKGASNLAILVYYFVVFSFAFVHIAMSISKDVNLIKLLFVCIISFILIPILIYFLSYLLFPGVSYYDGTVSGVLKMNGMMYNYHSTLDATHPFSSSWYSWPVMATPVWFYTGGTLSGLYITITDIGNPAIWWCGVVSLIYLVINAIKKKDKNSIFLLIFILSTIVPYIFIGRLMFMYHYFITLPFIMLGIVSFIKWITERIKNDRVYYGYIALIIFTFILFYPITSGMPISSEYVESLKWLSSWTF